MIVLVKKELRHDMIVIPLRFFDMPNALFLEILAWFTQALPGLSDLRILIQMVALFC